MEFFKPANLARRASGRKGSKDAGRRSSKDASAASAKAAAPAPINEDDIDALKDKLQELTAKLMGGDESATPEYER